MKNFKSLALMFAFILVLGVLAACGGSGDDASGDEGNSESSGSEGSSTEESGEEVAGPIAIDGSSTVYPIMENLTYSYREEAPEVETSLNSSGSFFHRVLFKNYFIEVIKST